MSPLPATGASHRGVGYGHQSEIGSEIEIETNGQGEPTLTVICPKAMTRMPRRTRATRKMTIWTRTKNQAR
jgi:hypothetical protein